ncbi:hypothetical protein AB0O74_34200 [Streptomyces rubiginosohelvolus]|uniref:hypothetical protein n=1 Tax=Streptomyces rubiginosohelvolus TaxID=67362 RepID=UPI00342CA691
MSAAQLTDRLLPVSQPPEQAAHQLVHDGRRAAAENPRFGGGLEEDIFTQVLEGLTPRSDCSTENGQGANAWRSSSDPGTSSSGR